MTRSHDHYPSGLANIVWAEQQRCGSPLEKLLLFYLADRTGYTAVYENLVFDKAADYCCCSPDDVVMAIAELERRTLLFVLAQGPMGATVAMPWWRPDGIEVIRPTSRTVFPQGLRKVMHDCQEGKCWYCATVLADLQETPHIDHQIPVSRGGLECAENLCLACPKCNVSKRDKTVSEFREYVIRRDGLPKSFKFWGESR